MKLDDQHLLELRCELEELVTTRSAFEATNQEREQRGESLVYSEEAFYDLQNKIKSIRERMIHLGEK